MVNWKICSQAMENGSLGLGNLKNRNSALCFKWNWRFFTEPNTFCCKIVRSIHWSDSSHWHPSGKSGLSLHSPWISILKKWSSFDHFVSFKLGDGQRITFWKDSWCLAQPFSLAFPDLYQISANPEAKVSTFWDSSASSWCPAFRCALKDEKIEEFQLLLSGLQVIAISPCFSRSLPKGRGQEGEILLTSRSLSLVSSFCRWTRSCCWLLV